MPKIVFRLFIILMLFTGCQNNKLRVPISNIDLAINIQRFEKSLFELKPESIPENILNLEEEYGQFLSLFAYVLNIGQPGDSTFPDMLKSFATDRLNNEVFQATLESYPDIISIENELTSNFRRYLYYYPERDVPKIYTFISGFNSSIIIDEHILAIGLDRYLGADCKYYPQLGIPNYQSRNMIRDKIPYDCMYGKLNYFVNAMIPEANEAMIFGFTVEQLEWCKANEGDMWTYLVENQLIYNTERFTIRKLIGDAPFTSFFPKESPGKAANWLGYQIVKQYLDKNENTSLQELMENSDYQEILQLSKYDPR